VFGLNGLQEWAKLFCWIMCETITAQLQTKGGRNWKLKISLPIPMFLYIPLNLYFFALNKYFVMHFSKFFCPWKFLECVFQTFFQIWTRKISENTFQSFYTKIKIEKRRIKKKHDLRIEKFVEINTFPAPKNRPRNSFHIQQYSRQLSTITFFKEIENWSKNDHGLRFGWDCNAVVDSSLFTVSRVSPTKGFWIPKIKNKKFTKSKLQLS
jgi:hypothetical protein